MKKKSGKTGPRPHCQGPRPHVWVSGPDPVVHQKYRHWIQQKNQAQFRDEGWTIPFELWVEMWGDLWYNRGRQRGDYCMTRIDRELPWTPDNVHVITREAHARTQARLAAAGYRSPARQKYRDSIGQVEDKKSGPKGPRTPK